MSLTYSLRLLCICFSSFFLVQAAIGVIVSIAALPVIRAAGGMTPRFASDFLFSVRMMPLGMAGFVVFGLCVPSYLWLEPTAGGEQVGWPCVAIALLGLATCFLSAMRMIKAGSRSRQFGKACVEIGHEVRMGKDSAEVMIVQLQSPLLAVAGIFRPKLIVSTSILQALSGEELDAALRHERAHRIWRDNFKRLLFLAAPRGFVLSHRLGAIDREWAKFAEWAADDHAAGGNPHSALALAAALVRIARVGMIAAQPAIVSSFVGGPDLSERVDRLLRSAPSSAKLFGKTRALMSALAVAVTFSIATVALWPASLSAVHYLLERLID